MARSALLAVLLGLAVASCAGGRAEPALLDARLTAGSEGTDFVFTVPEPCDVLVAVALPQDCEQETQARLRRLRVAMRPDVVYEPEAGGPPAFTVKPGTTTAVHLGLPSAGAYVLRVEPIPMAMGSEHGPRRIHAVVRRR